ncbi:MAG: fumarylacetoacetate hydrolase family protein [Anaerolineae bacterium]|jgi:2-keto-4-pentenoate hydratase/2-oxohepta-3-ene-1,7-dioic acid hydratase in catechol pathway|nr:fumarylacetoacetate hydrolase family protein [Anaerolineae bacterium]
MKLLHFSTPDAPQLRLGALTERGVVDLAAAAALRRTDVPSTLEDVFALGSSGLAQLKALLSGLPASGPWLIPDADLTYGACVPNPEKIICVGLNYRLHAQESGAAIPTSPILFGKFNNSLAAHNEVVPIPAVTQQADYEVELAVVIGRECRDVPVESAFEVVFGYCTANDFSARDLQTRTTQWLLGKSLDKFQPMGPYLVTKDEVPNPDDLWLRTWVNGDLRQDSVTSDMVFDVATLVSYASQHMTLKPGDVISTGTPAGVILGLSKQGVPYLKAGDVVEVEVQGLGRLRNVMG